MTRADLPVQLPGELLFENPETRASQAEVDIILADHNFPDMMPQVPLTRDQMDVQWTDSQLSTGAPPFPGGAMPTYFRRLDRACYGTPPHGKSVPAEDGHRRDWRY